MDFFIKINLIIEKIQKSKNCCFSTAHAQGAEFRMQICTRAFTCTRGGV